MKGLGNETVNSEKLIVNSEKGNSEKFKVNG